MSRNMEFLNSVQVLDESHSNWLV